MYNSFQKWRNSSYFIVTNIITTEEPDNLLKTIKLNNNMLTIYFVLKQ